jgi:LPXTG-motif cell wall-anchored protein
MTVHVSSRRRVAGGLAAVAAGAIALAGAFPGAAGATSATGDGDHDDLPFEHPCPDEGYYFVFGHELPNNQESIPGTHTQDEAAMAAEGDFSVEISNVQVVDDHKSFDFTTSVPVSAVFVMGNPRSDPEGNSYDYEPAVTEGTGLTSGDQWVKHVVFCVTPPPPTTESTTTTTEATTTTTVEETTTTSAPPSSETTVTTPPTSVEDTTPTTAPTTAPPTTQPIGEELPRTGNNTMPLVAGAGALIALGAAAVIGRRYLQNRA